MKTEMAISNDLVIISYFMKENGWDGANKTNYQRILYFATALAPVFIPNEDNIYIFSNTIFGPYNRYISDLLRKTYIKGYLDSIYIKVYQNRIEERYTISKKGVELCENILFKIDNYSLKISWYKIIIKVLSIYGENFLSKLIKEDPNINEQKEMNITNSKLITDNSSDNLTKEFFLFLKEKGVNNFHIKNKNNEDYLLLFFDVLYRKYKGGNV